MLPKPERSATYPRTAYKHSRRFLLAHEIDAWQMDNDLVRSAYRYTFDSPDQLSVRMTDIVADQPLGPLTNL